MTWRQMKERIEEMEDRFLDTEIQVFDVENNTTHIGCELYCDCDDTDYVIDKDQPQIWINFSEFNLE